MASSTDLSEYEKDPRLFLFTSLTAGSSHIISATSRMETILKANRIPFLAVDLATDEKARRLWQRRAQKKKLPGLVKDGFVLGDLEDVEEWSEFGELKENIGNVPASNAAPAGSSIQGVSTAPPIDHNVPGLKTATNATLMRPLALPIGAEETRIALPGAAEIAAMSKAKKEKEAAAKATPEPPVATTPPVVEAATSITPATASTSTPVTEPESASAKPTIEPTEPVTEPSSGSATEPATEPPTESTIEAVNEPATVPEASTSQTEDASAGKHISAQHPSLDHLSAPASAIQSGTATPQPLAEPSDESPLKHSSDETAQEPSTVTPAATLESSDLVTKLSEEQSTDSGAKPVPDAPNDSDSKTQDEISADNAEEAPSTTSEPLAAPPADSSADAPTTSTEPAAESATASTEPSTTSKVASTPQTTTAEVTSATSPPPDTPTSTHRGSEVREASPEEIKKLEEANALPEAANEDEDTETVAKDLHALKVDDAETIQHQEAKDGAGATKSVED